MRALQPTRSGTLDALGFRIGFEVFGEAGGSGDPAPVLLLPSWQIVPSRHWRMQVPHLARSRMVITYDPPGNGAGERTTDPAAFALERVVDYGPALLDHLGVERADVAGLSMGGTYGLWMAARHPERVARLVVMGTAPPAFLLADPGFRARRERYEGWERRNAHYWREHYQDWLEFFFGEVCSDPHSTKALEDCLRWGQGITAEALIASVAGEDQMPAMTMDEVVAKVRCPVLVVHGGDDRIADVATGRALAAARPDWGYVELRGAGHAFHLREPVRTNLLLDDFLGVPTAGPRELSPGRSRPSRRALWVCSPIGLGHVQRDLAIARALRGLAPDLEIEWLAQEPVAEVLRRAGERLHPASAGLVSESAHWESWAGEHRLHCFYAWRDMDEVLLANFMVFLEAARGTPYDLWVGDEAWEVDHHLHECPELKTAPYAFLTDFVGWVPMDRAPGSREAALTADHNAQMAEQVARYPRVRDRALYLGELADLPSEPLAPGLPTIPDWTAEHLAVVGDVLPFDPSDYADVRAVRGRLGHDPDAPLVVAAVGGTAAGGHLLQKVLRAWPAIRAGRPDARLMLVAGPRIAPSALPSPGGDPTAHGVEVRRYVHDLYEHLAVCDLGIVQGGLSTTMELTAARRPFLAFPLHDHCEQQVHVGRRLRRRRAGHRLDYDATGPGALAAAALQALGADTGGYAPHRPGGATRAAALLAELL